MKLLLTITLFLLFVLGINAQDLEVDGTVKITEMTTVTNATDNVVWQPDGTLAVTPIGPITYAVGDFAQGGDVFWVNASGKHGKAVSIYDFGRIQWTQTTMGFVEIGITAQSDINGAGNTVAMMLQPNNITSSALHCADLTYGGFDDWYLPSKNELNQIYTNRATINATATATANGGEVFENYTFWSSTELNNERAWHQDFVSGLQSFSFKSYYFNFRPIRAF